MAPFIAAAPVMAPCWFGFSSVREMMARVAQAYVLSACGAVLLVSGCADPPAPPPPSPMAVSDAQAAQPASQEVITITMAAAEVVVLPATTVKLRLDIDRTGDAGVVTLDFGAAPDGVSLEAAPIAENVRFGEVLITADERLGDTELVMAIPVTATVGGLATQAMVNVRVPKQEPPRLIQEAEVVVQPGTKAMAPLMLEWPPGPRQPFSLAMREAQGDVAPDPAGSVNQPVVVVAPLDVSADDEAAVIEVTVADDAPDGSRIVPLAMEYKDRAISVELRVRVMRRPFTIGELRAIWLRPGESRTVTLPVKRVAHDGAIDVSVSGLPEGVTAVATPLAPGDKEVTLELRAAEDATPRVRSAYLVGQSGGLRVDDPIVVRVLPEGADTSLPPAVFAGRDAARLVQRGSIGGRLSKESKESLSELYGGTPEAQAAIRRGLAWLARTQQADGSWTLKGAAELPAGEPADDEPQSNATAATAFGILPFLGEGITHKQAPDTPKEFAGYKSVVEKGLVYLASKQVRGKAANDGFFGDSMYAHCLATIAFCEAYGLTRDERARYNARQGIKYLLAAQDPDGGGWRYGMRQKGDLSVTGWVVIALRSAQLANLSVSMKQLHKVEEFLDAVADGPSEAPKSRYRYEMGKPETITMTAAGLLSRQYLGWAMDEPDLAAGRDYLMEKLPPAYAEDLGPLYFYYYATQVLHHLEGEEFDIWNHRMREHLLRLQRVSGELEGSWDPRGSDRGSSGGRMYSTVLSLLTLQVYYRHLPMYREVGKPSSAASDSESVEPAADDDPESKSP